MNKFLVMLLTLVFVFSVPMLTLSAEEVTVTVAGGAVGEELELTRRAAEMYMDENPDVRVTVLDTPDMVEDRRGLYLQFFESRSSQVDIYQIDVIWPGDMAEHFVDLYEYGAAEVIDQHFPAIVENNTVDGKLIGIPWFTDAGLLYYRTDLLEKYELDVPTTWTQLEEAAQIIKDGEREDGNRDFQGFVWQGGPYEGMVCNALEWIASAGGGTIISPEGEITINNDHAAEIISQAAGWVGTISPTGILSYAEEDARAVWQNGNAAFMRNWPYAYSLSRGEDSPIRDDFAVTTLPAVEGHEPAHTLGGWQLAVSQYSDNPEIAADVALFLAGYESQLMRATDGSMNPTIAELYEHEAVLEANPFFGDLYEVFVNAVARPSTISAPRYAEVSDAFVAEIHPVLSGDADVYEALEYLEDSLIRITDLPTGSPQ